MQKELRMALLDWSQCPAVESIPGMAGRAIAVVVIGVQQWPALQPHVALCVAAVNAATPGSFTEVAD
jgi:hypothetical protein